jgi:hypothetical protein
MKTCLLIAALAGFAHAPAAYPIEPVPLRSLILAADLIAVVQPGPTRELADKEGFARTLLTLEKQFKGDLEEETIFVHSMPGLICPVDAAYPEGQRTLVFLSLVNGEWRACSLSYGAKTLEAAGLQVYEDRIRDFLALRRLKDAKQRDQAELDWIVSVTLDPHTRWEGAFELRATNNSFAQRLSAEQRAALLDALLAAPRRDEGSRELFEFFRAEKDPRLIRWMIDCLEKESADRSWSYDDAIIWIDDRLADPGLRDWVKATWSYSGAGAQKRLHFEGGAKSEEKVREAESAAILAFVKKARAVLERN